MNKKPLHFVWPQELVDAIDEARGLVPRSAFVRAAVEAKLPVVIPAEYVSEDEMRQKCEEGAWDAMGESQAFVETELAKPRYKCRHCDFNSANPKAFCPKHAGALKPIS